MKFKVNSINKKVLIVVGIVFILPYMLSSFYITSFIEKKVEDDYIKLSDQQMDRIYYALYYNVIEQASQAINVFSKRKETKNLIQNIDNKICKSGDLDPTSYDYLEIYKDARKNYITAIGIGTEKGGYFEYPGSIYGEEETYNPRVRPWYVPAITNPDQIIVSDPYVKTNGEYAIAVSKAVIGDDKKPIGVIGIGWDIGNFQKEVQSVKIGLSGYIIILDKNNNMIINQKQEIGISEISKLNTDSNSIQRLIVDDKIKYARVKTTSTGWKILSIMDADELDMQIFNIVNSIRITYVFTLIIITIVFMVIYLRFYSYIRKLLDAACAIMKGNKRIKIDDARNDELGVIAKALNKMIIEVEKRNKELCRLNGLNLVGQMASGIAHEIRNPMTTVRGYLQLMCRKQELEKYKDRFDLMIDELDRANSIITEFLSLAKNKAVNLELNNLNTIISNIYPLLNSDALLQNKELETDFDYSLPEVLVDEKEIRQLILNLVRNGFDAMDERKTLTIKTSFSNEEVILAIKDEGTGIDPKILENIGIPFMTTKDTGTGLGLPVCYSIAARNNAAIVVDSSENGTTFYVKFKTVNINK